MKFTWDTVKERTNKKKHGVSFEQASTCFYDPMHILMVDPDHSRDETRLILIGRSLTSKLLVVVHVDTEPDDLIRIISARKATKSERRQYEGNLK